MAKKTNFASPLFCVFPTIESAKHSFIPSPKDLLADTKKHRFGKAKLAETVLSGIFHLT
ncbi:MAG: hypothetical protein IJC93_08070 [Clostridia bacterium]|nr:hypothetical protein [Clostridia bacterium]